MIDIMDPAENIRTLADVEAERIARAAGRPTRLIVGLTGYKGSGKSTAAQRLVDRYGFEIIPFAGPLKDMMRAIGATEDEIEGELKETPRPWLCGTTPRRAMQTLGTEWGRNIIGQDFWVNLWKSRAATTARHVVVPDLRFPSEAMALRSLGATLYFVERPRDGEIDQHESERQVRAIAVDGAIYNSGDLPHLYRQVDRIANTLLSNLEDGNL